MYTSQPGLIAPVIVLGQCAGKPIVVLQEYYSDICPRFHEKTACIECCGTLKFIRDNGGRESKVLDNRPLREYSPDIGQQEGPGQESLRLDCV